MPMTKYKPRTVRISALAMTTLRIFFELSQLGSVGAGAIELLVEASGVEGARGGRDAGEDRESDQGRCDGLHGCSPVVGLGARCVRARRRTLGPGPFRAHLRKWWRFASVFRARKDLPNSGKSRRPGHANGAQRFALRIRSASGVATWRTGSRTA